MGTQVVRHKSRILTEDFEFVADGETAWSFDVDCPGEIFEVETDNIASYTIDSETISLPYTLTKGNTYSVSITKTTSSATAYLKLKIRRAEDQTNIINVPDYSDRGTGDYYYVLLNNNTLLKYDCSLLIPSNWDGTDDWTSTPLISTITLPTLPNSTYYQFVKYVIISGSKYLILGAKDISTSSQDMYFSKLDPSTDTITDLDLGTTTLYTTLSYSTSAVAYSQSIKKVLYDYINNYLYCPEQGSDPTYGMTVNLNDNTVVESYEYDDYFYHWLRGLEVGGNLQLNPTSEAFVDLVEIDLINKTSNDYVTYTNNNNIWGYYFADLAEITSKNSLANLYLVNRDNVIETIIASSNDGTTPVGRYTNRNICPSSNLQQIFMSYATTYYIFDIANTDGVGGEVSDNTATHVGDNCFASDANGTFISLESDGSAYVQRINIFKYGETPMRFGYIDTDYVILDSTTTQLNI